MRIAIPSNDKMNILYHLRFANGFMIYDTVNGKIQDQFYQKLIISKNREREIKANSYTQIVESLTSCDLIILYAMNSEIQYEFNKARIDIFLTSATNLKGAVDLFLQDRLINIS